MDRSPQSRVSLSEVPKSVSLPHEHPTPADNSLTRSARQFVGGEMLYNECDIVSHDPDGPSRVVARFPTFADYVDLAVGQIRRYGASEPQVAYALLRLLQVAGAQTRDSQRRQVLASHVRLVLADAERTICQPADLALLQSEGEILLQTLAG